MKIPNRPPTVPPKPKNARAIALGLILICVLTPLQFYLRFGTIDGYGWGVTIFLFLLALLIEVGDRFLFNPEFLTPIATRGKWVDKVGGFWLIACAFAPFFGWVLTQLVPVNQDNWRWVYGLRTGLCMGLPLLTAMPLARYLRGKSARVGAPILLGITFLAMMAGWWTLRDLVSGPSQGLLQIAPPYDCQVLEPVTKSIPCEDEWGEEWVTVPVVYLRHTHTVLDFAGTFDGLQFTGSPQTKTIPEALLRDGGLPRG
jgi:hypothetical protein